MAVTHVPSFWDYLGQGASGFVQNLHGVQEMKLRQAAEERAKSAEQRAGRLFDAQIRPYDVAQQILDDKTPTSTILPSLIGGPSGAIATVPLPGRFSENDYAMARVAVPSLESPRSRMRRERTEDLSTREKELDLTAKRNRLPVSALEGTTAAAALPGAAGDVQRSRVKDLEPIVQEFAGKFVAGQILESGGRLQGKNLAQMSANAFAAFTSDPAILEQLGSAGLSFDSVKAAVDKAVSDAWSEQRKLDIEDVRARAYASGQTVDRTPQLMNALTNTAKLFEGRVAELNKDVLRRLNAQTNPNSPEAQAFNQEIANYQRVTNLLTAASSGLAAGTVSPDEASVLLNQASAMIQAQGQSQEPPPGQPNPQALDDASVQAEALKYGPPRWRAWLKRGVELGRITQEQADRVLSSLERRKPS